MDSVSAKSAESIAVAAASLTVVVRDPAAHLNELSGVTIEEFYEAAHAESVELRPYELAAILIAVGQKYNFGFEASVVAKPAQIGAFWRALHLEDLALAHACAFGREAAWRQFIARFREPLTRAAAAITGSADAGRELADSLYSEMYGLSVRNGERQSPLSSYSGRGSLHGFLRASLAQRNVDRHRRVKREEPLTWSASAAARDARPDKPQTENAVLPALTAAVTRILERLAPEERFLLSSWFLDRRTLLEISRLLSVHEATVSRRIQRLTARLHDELLAGLRALGLGRAAAEDALRTDPRDLDVNVRSVLRASQPAAFHENALDPEP